MAKRPVFIVIEGGKGLPAPAMQEDFSYLSWHPEGTSAQEKAEHRLAIERNILETDASGLFDFESKPADPAPGPTI